MRWIATGAAAAAVFAASVIAALAAWPIGEERALPGLKGDAARGAYLARASGCIACHTDIGGGGRPLAGGAPLATDFGTFYPPNLTTDPEHGIGAWTQEDFARAVRQGVSPAGEPYYPAFTYPFYANFTDQEIADLWAAFQTVPPAAEPDRPHELGFPFSQRWGLKLWRAAFLEPPATGPVPGKSDAWNRGRALVEGAAHCAACHSGRNLAGARVPELRFKGNGRLPGGAKAPPIHPASLRANGWDADALAFGLKTGLTPSGDAMGGSMGEVVFQGTAFLTEADRRAMAAYLLDLPEGG